MKIEPLNLQISESLKYIIKLQEELQTKMDNSILGIPTHYLGMRSLSEDENKALEKAFTKSLQKQTTLKRK